MKELHDYIQSMIAMRIVAHSCTLDHFGNSVSRLELKQADKRNFMVLNRKNKTELDIIVSFDNGDKEFDRFMDILNCVDKNRYKIIFSSEIQKEKNIKIINNNFDYVRFVLRPGKKRYTSFFVKSLYR